MVPKYHLSEPRWGVPATIRDRRAHSGRCLFLPASLPPTADLMIEAKDKEQAVFDLARIYGLREQPREAEDLVPPEGFEPKSEEPPLEGRTYSREELQADRNPLVGWKATLEREVQAQADMALRAEEIREHLRNTGKRLKYERGAGEEDDAPGTAAKFKSKKVKAGVALEEELANQPPLHQDQYGDVANGNETVTKVEQGDDVCTCPLE